MSRVKVVDVYHVSSRRVQAVGDVVEIVHMKPFVQPTYVSGDVEEGTATIAQVPVHCYRMPDGSDRYLAVEPELRELIEAYIAKPLQEELGRVRLGWSADKRCLARLLMRFERFEKQPLWRRLVAAWKGVLA